MRTETTVIPALIEKVAEAGKLLGYRNSLLISAIDVNGTGYVFFDDLVAGLMIGRSRAQAYRIVKSACDGGFCRKVLSTKSERFIVKILSMSDVLGRFGIARIGRVVRIPVEAIEGPSYKRGLYLAFAADRNWRPTARVTRTAKTGYSKTSQIRAEKAGGVVRERNYVEDSPSRLDAPNTFVRTSDGKVFSEISITTYVPSTVARRIKRRVSAPIECEGVYKTRCQRRYHDHEDGALRSGKHVWPVGYLDDWRPSEDFPNMITGPRLLVLENPGLDVHVHNGMRVRSWREFSIPGYREVDSHAVS